jgi:hypothetical protein
MSKSQHVVPKSDGGWAVRQSGTSRASKTFSTKGDAVSYARDRAKQGRGELYIHGKDGTIQGRDSFGSKPEPREKR